jgi:hypothetical protein
MKKIIPFIAFLVLLVLGGGCAQFGTYMKDRGNDFVDCFGFRLMGGPGMLFNVRCTQVVQVGAGVAAVTDTGFLGREMYPADGTIVGEAGVPFYYSRGYIGGGVASPKRSAGRTVIGIFPKNEDGFCSVDKFDKEYDRQFFDVGFTFHLLMFGLNLEFRLKEFADFLLGWFGADITGDDTKRETTREPEAADNPAP